MEWIAITPDEFQSIALAWVTAITIVGGALVAALVSILPKLSALRQAMRDAQSRLDDHSRRITANNDRVTQVALEISPSKREEEKSK